ncbi:MAG: HDOD domain-containing protein [Deltaproteobacteria bacterium]|nr:HDOD domain-containing protein [Deltaproteobacteria bacterium]
MQKDQSFIEIIEEYVESDKITLPPFDKTALRIQQEIQKKDVKLSRIEKLIIADPAMSSQVLKLANSSFFRGLSKVMTVRESIIRLGLDEITRMVMILSQKKLYTTKNSFIRNYRNILWQHALVCALVSQWVAREAGFEETTQEVFFASLMHDIGKLFLITVIEKIKISKEAAFMPSKTVINEIINSQHTRQGYNLLKKWNLPDQYCQVTKKHHDKKFDNANVPLIILRLVNKTCNKIGVSIEARNDAANSVTAEANFFGFSEIKLAELELQIEDSVKRVSSHYNIGKSVRKG